MDWKFQISGLGLNIASLSSKIVIIMVLLNVSLWSWSTRTCLAVEGKHQSDSHSLIHYKESYENFFSRSNELCSKEGVNIVLNRHESYGIDNPSELRPWSLKSTSYLTGNYDLPICRTLEDLLLSVKFGMRIPIEGFSDQPSPNFNVFAPFSCAYKWYSPEESCEVLSHFSAIHFVGDSIVRQTMLALKLILSGDYARGAIKRLHDTTQDEEQLRNCICDGQFSEALKCRDHDDWEKPYIVSTEYGFCSKYQSFGLTPVAASMLRNRLDNSLWYVSLMIIIRSY